MELERSCVLKERLRQAPIGDYQESCVRGHSEEARGACYGDQERCVGRTFGWG